MWYHKKSDKTKKGRKEEEFYPLQEAEQAVPDIDTTFIMSKEEKEETRLIWKGTSKEYTLHLTDVNNPGRTFKAPIDGSVTVGRKAEESDIAIDYERSVSARHCRISARDGKFYVEDLDSANGTLINGIPVMEEMELYSESTLTLGRLQLKVQIR
ncbi:MAG: FHA domain-containing protein [Eubacterium sp.]|nr:FHA domain-containing protein [Eubacterium sp.]